MAKNPFLTLENRYKVCREYAELWQNYFKFFADDMEEKQITQEMETEFQNIMNIIALNHFKFSELCGEFMSDPMDILEILSKTISLQEIKDMTDATRNKMLVEWHTTFVDMNKALGKILSRMSPKELEALQITEGPGTNSPAESSAPSQ
jgi:hypothetical protein